MNIYYVYTHHRPDGSIFYVGKGKGKCAYQLKACKRNSHHQNIVAKYGRENISVEFVKKNLTEEQAHRLEIRTIAKLRKQGVELINMTDGGEGLSNPPQSVRERLRVTKLGKNNPMYGKPGTRLGMIGIRSSQYGKPGSMLGRHHTLETREKISQAGRGRLLSPQASSKVSEAMTKLNARRREWVLLTGYTGNGRYITKAMMEEELP